MRDKRFLVELLIAGLLIFSVWSFTRYHRNELVLTLQNDLQVQNNGIARTQQIIQGAINNGTQINFKALADIGWVFTAPPQPAVPSTKDNPSK